MDRVTLLEVCDNGAVACCEVKLGGILYSQAQTTTKPGTVLIYTVMEYKQGYRHTGHGVDSLNA